MNISCASADEQHYAEMNHCMIAGRYLDLLETENLSYTLHHCTVVVMAISNSKQRCMVQM